MPYFTDGFFRSVQERHKEIHHDLTSVSWEGDIDEIPKTCLKITHSEKRRQDILKHGEIAHDRKLKQLQKYRLPDDPQVIAEKQRYAAWRKCWEENKPSRKEQIKQELRFRGWGTFMPLPIISFWFFWKKTCTIWQRPSERLPTAKIAN